MREAQIAVDIFVSLAYYAVIKNRDGKEEDSMMTEAQIAARRANINRLIESAGATFLAVEFVKKDQTVRTMQVQLFAGRDDLAGDTASESRQQAVVTRKENNPNLRNVWDIAKKAWRSINLDSVLSVTVRGTRFEVGPLPTAA